MTAEIWFSKSSWGHHEAHLPSHMLWTLFTSLLLYSCRLLVIRVISSFASRTSFIATRLIAHVYVLLLCFTYLHPP